CAASYPSWLRRFALNSAPEQPNPHERLGVTPIDSAVRTLARELVSPPGLRPSHAHRGDSGVVQLRGGSGKRGNGNGGLNRRHLRLPALSATSHLLPPPAYAQLPPARCPRGSADTPPPRSPAIPLTTLSGAVARQKSPPPRPTGSCSKSSP